MHMYIVLISGRAGSGKDAFADLITSSSTHRSNTMKLGFADPIREIAVKYSDGRVTTDDLQHSEVKASQIIHSEHKSPTHRRGLQLIGTEFSRSHRPSIWVDILRARCGQHPSTGLLESIHTTMINSHQWYTSIGACRAPAPTLGDASALIRRPESAPSVVLVTDWRFDNEQEELVEAVKTWDGVELVTVCVDRHISEGSKPGKLSASEKAHASEGGVSSHLVQFVIDNTGTLEDLKEKATRFVKDHLRSY
eukprot:gnl/Dysnectes_brevis/3344_a4201_927.p1 GENE.gnl/Dysnectes_brevis/3344_a4201_927~~gnl/Dysnectes_brevis/3344_a4201_927.p1  ORF type:complete len:251 (-),score=17.50 gnl/Dysnectes_brevis/3344_a4201_927:124-876(-)